MRAPQDNATVEPGGLLRLRPGFFGGVDEGIEGNTLLNYAGVEPEICCRSSVLRRRPRRASSCLAVICRSCRPMPCASAGRCRADPALNIAAEVAEQHGYIRNWGRRFVVAIPSPTLL